MYIQGLDWVDLTGIQHALQCDRQITLNKHDDGRYDYDDRERERDRMMNIINV
jgi:hypothetical protein